MYTDAAGRELLKQLRPGLEALGELDAPQFVAVDLSVHSWGAAFPRPSALELFHSTIPNIRLRPGETAHDFTIRVTKKRVLTSAGGEVTLDQQTATTAAFTEADQFATALSISSRSLIVSHRATFHGLHVSGTTLTSGDHIEIQMRPVLVQHRNPDPLHAGELYGAIDTWGHLLARGWAARYFECYRKGALFAAQPIMPLLNFTEEAYLCFFKCLEYIVMVQVLGRRGQLNPKAIRDAFKKLGLRPTGASENPDAVYLRTGSHLVRQRGKLAAHLLVGAGEVQCSPQDLAELKGLVDFLVRAYVKGKFQRQRP